MRFSENVRLEIKDYSCLSYSLKAKAVNTLVGQDSYSISYAVNTVGQVSVPSKPGGKHADRSKVRVIRYHALSVLWVRLAYKFGRLNQAVNSVANRFVDFVC